MEIRLTSGQVINAREGATLKQALTESGVFLVSPCGGKGTCGKCIVKILDGSVNINSYGKLTGSEIDSGLVLACQSTPKGPLSVDIPENSKLTIGDKIAQSKAGALKSLYAKMYEEDSPSPLASTVELTLPPPSIDDNISDLERVNRALSEHGIEGLRYSHDFALELGHKLRQNDWRVNLLHIDSKEAILLSPPGELPRRAISIDIGTTTVVVYLVDVTTGELIDTGSTYNSQTRFGDDVITRIVHATERGDLRELRQAVLEDINEILEAMRQKHGFDPLTIESAVLAGNTTMTQMLWGLDPGAIREEPYIPTINTYPLWHAGSAGININPQAPVFTLPCVASYVGGDITAGVLASGMTRLEEITLFMDIGTNGEIAIGNNEWLVTAACSAGPCFEGGGIRHGMRATEGAIEKAHIDPETFEPELAVIGGSTAVGICGSGMIDALSSMFKAGLIDQKGRFVEGLPTRRLKKGPDGMEFILCDGGGVCAKEDITLTEVDIDNIMRAKAAIYAGVTVLLGQVGLTVDMLHRVYIAGGFGNFLDVEKSITIGMLPDLPRDKYVFLGNTSASGAYLCLLSEKARTEALDILSRMTYMELSVSGSFMDEYMSALFLPHTDASRFPSV